MSDGFIAQTRALIKRRGAGRVARYALEAAAAHLVYGVFRVMSLDAASATGGALMRWLGPKLARTKTTVLPQLAVAFPEKTDAQRYAIACDMWENIGRVFAEYSHLDDIMSRVTVVGREHLDAARDSGQPLIFVTGHIGNWELSSITVQSAGIDVNIVYRAPNNPWVENLLQRARRAGSTGGLIRKGAAGARQMLSVMRQNKAIGILVDQKLSGAPLAPLFGQEAYTSSSVHVFATKFNPRVHYVRIERLAGAYFRATISPQVEVSPDQATYLAAMNAELESWIRVHPAQWLWTHRRWER